MLFIFAYTKRIPKDASVYITVSLTYDDHNKIKQTIVQAGN